MGREGKEGTLIVYPNREPDHDKEPDFWGWAVIDGEKRRVQLWQQPTGALSGFVHDLHSEETRNIFDF